MGLLDTYTTKVAGIDLDEATIRRILAQRLGISSEDRQKGLKSNRENTSSRGLLQSSIGLMGQADVNKNYDTQDANYTQSFNDDLSRLALNRAQALTDYNNAIAAEAAAAAEKKRKEAEDAQARREQILRDKEARDAEEARRRQLAISLNPNLGLRDNPSSGVDPGIAGGRRGNEITFTPGPAPTPSFVATPAKPKPKAPAKPKPKAPTPVKAKAPTRGGKLKVY